ncbi:MAG: DUF819 family protein [Pilosibacter sp.]
MLAIQAILDVSEESLAYSLVMDSVCAVIYVMFLLWVINFSKEFNSWTKADVRLIDEVRSISGKRGKGGQETSYLEKHASFNRRILLYILSVQGCRCYGCVCSACF